MAHMRHEDAMTAVAPEAAGRGMRGLQGKNVLITGGASGIGQAIAVRFAGYGANIALNYLRTLADAKETEEKVHACLASVRQTGVRDVLVGGDVSKEEDVVAMFDSAVQQLGGLDVLVNNAGIQISRPPTSCPRRTSTRSSPSTCAARFFATAGDGACPRAAARRRPMTGSQGRSSSTG
jgi:NAD(P)-dependent dehydrogenase (short-subunit alcohol dehydrogenase family)